MPTVLRVGGFSFGFYSDEHNPPHVHCKNADGVAIVEIATGRLIRRTGKIRKRDAQRAATIVTENSHYLHNAWTEFANKRGARQ